MKATIYSLEALHPGSREGIHEGIGMAAAAIGEPLAIEEKRIRLPADSLGRIDPEKVGFGKFDPYTELHVVAAPFRPKTGRTAGGGLAYHMTGCALVNSAAPREATRVFTAHEVAHGLGFVRLDASYSDSASWGHCGCDSCIMKKAIEIETPDGTMSTSTPVRLLQNQHDFCVDCKVDMREHGQSNLRQLRIERMAGSLTHLLSAANMMRAK